MFAWDDSDEEFADQKRAEGLGNRLEAGDIEEKVFYRTESGWIGWVY